MFFNTQPSQPSQPSEPSHVNADVIVSSAYFILPCTTLKAFYIQEVQKRTFKKEVRELNQVFYGEKFFTKNGDPIKPAKMKDYKHYCDFSDYYSLGIVDWIFDTKEDAELALQKIDEHKVYFDMINIFYNCMINQKVDHYQTIYRNLIPYFQGFAEIKKKILKLKIDKNNFYNCFEDLKKEWQIWIQSEIALIDKDKKANPKKYRTW
jgi:hypothetical protein